MMQVVRIDESLLADGFVTIEDDGKLWVPTIDGDVMALGDVTELTEEQSGTRFRSSSTGKPVPHYRFVSEWVAVDGD